jgi:periplasmic protein TonB
MFEDSTFESTGRIKTRSRRWMIATFTINGSIVLALILIPLVFPAALPRQVIPFLMVAPAAPTPQTPPPVREQPHASRDLSEISDGHLLAPTSIPPIIKILTGPEAPFASTALTMEPGPAVPGSGENPFGSRRAVAVVHPDNAGPVRVSSMVVEGLIIRKTIPQYPPVPRAMGVQGTVVLQATISRSGTIENLRVISGPAMLQQAALDAVKTWRYKPYMLNEQPVEVETTVNVVFSISH